MNCILQSEGRTLRVVLNIRPAFICEFLSLFSLWNAAQYAATPHSSGACVSCAFNSRLQTFFLLSLVWEV